MRDSSTARTPLAATAMRALSLVALVVATVDAHMAVWTDAMYGASKAAQMPLQNVPFSDYWFRGSAFINDPPKKGAITVLPAGKSIKLPIACQVRRCAHSNWRVADRPGEFGAGLHAWRRSDPTNDRRKRLHDGRLQCVTSVSDLAHHRRRACALSHLGHRARPHAADWLRARHRRRDESDNGRS